MAEVERLREQVEELEVEAADAEREIKQIADIHQSLLPTEMPEIEGITLAASHIAPNKAGGDYYDFIPLTPQPDPRGPWLVIVADASGHGPAAATIMAMLQAVLHAYTDASKEPGSVLEFMNQQMCKKKIEGSFTTAIVAVIEPESGAFAYACAGHHAPLLRKASGEVVELDCEEGGPPLAVDPDATMGGGSYTMTAGDTILLYTDGAIEQTAPGSGGADPNEPVNGGEQYGLPRLRAALADATADGSPRDVLAAINRDIRAHKGTAARGDDTTLVALRRQ